jgi:hypothetical protein
MLPKKVSCEVCGMKDYRILHYHHIVPQCDTRCTNSPVNIAVLCPNDHSRVHAGDIIILGIYSSSDGRCMIWYNKGEDPPLPEQFWRVRNNPLVLTIGGDVDDIDPSQFS